MTRSSRSLNKVKQDYGPCSVAFYSGYNKWYRPFLQRLCYDFGSVNYGTESSSCFTSTIMSWRLATGADFAAPDLRNAGIFLGWCYNAYYAQHLMIGGVDKARERGMKVIIVDPRITPAVEKQCDLHLRIKPGTDCALALGLARELIVNDWVDHDYIEKNVYGYEQYKQYVMDFTARAGGTADGRSRRSDPAGCQNDPRKYAAGYQPVRRGAGAPHQRHADSPGRHGTVRPDGHL